ncbi:hypothetical protein M5D96_010748, partial [Drosophila gunungcola]
LKKKIYDERGAEYVAEKQKLIYAGVILTDERTVGSYNVDEKKFIVVMLTRDSSGSKPNLNRTKESDKMTDTNSSKDTLAPEKLANASLQSRAESNLLMGDEYNQTVLSMVEMGYPREQVERAMAASYNNPERAVEYLINGLPVEEEAIFNVVDDPSTPSHLDSQRHLYCKLTSRVKRMKN